jgi:hypothetical protein
MVCELSERQVKKQGLCLKKWLKNGNVKIDVVAIIKAMIII